MPRRAGSIMGDYRKVRAGTYRLARTMGNWQPVLDGLIAGNLDIAVRGLVRRGIRRAAGRAFSAMQFGKGSGWGVVWEMALMLLGRMVGARGRH